MPGPGGCQIGKKTGLGGSGPGGVPGHGEGGASSRGVPDGDPPYGYCCGRYASYWNAFLFDIKKYKASSEKQRLPFRNQRT